MGGGVRLVPTPIVIRFKLKYRQNTAHRSNQNALGKVDCNTLRKDIFLRKNEFIFYSEAVSSINYIGRQLDVFYIGRQIYGEIIYRKELSIRPVKVGAPHAHFLQRELLNYCSQTIQKAPICRPMQTMEGTASEESPTDGRVLIHTKNVLENRTETLQN